MVVTQIDRVMRNKCTFKINADTDAKVKIKNRHTLFTQDYKNVTVIL